MVDITLTMEEWQLNKAAVLANVPNTDGTDAIAGLIDDAIALEPDALALTIDLPGTGVSIICGLHYGGIGSRMVASKIGEQA